MTSVATPQGCTNFKLRRLNRMVSRQYDAQLAGTGLKMTQYSLLSQVLRLGPVRPVDLAREINADASTLTRNLKPLVAAGWLAQVAGPDSRSHLLAITDSGREKRAEAQRLWQEAQHKLNQVLGVERVAALHVLLDQSIEMLQRAGFNEQASDD